MNTENVVELSTGVKVYLKSYLTRKAYREVQTLLVGGQQKVKASNIEDAEMSLDMGAFMESEELKVFYLIDKVTADEKEVKITPEWVAELPTYDFDVLNDKVNAIVSPKA